MTSIWLDFSAYFVQYILTNRNSDFVYLSRYWKGLKELICCSRSADPFYIVTYYLQWGKTSWAYSTLYTCATFYDLWSTMQLTNHGIYLFLTIHIVYSYNIHSSGNSQWILYDENISFKTKKFIKINWDKRKLRFSIQIKFCPFINKYRK